MNEPVKKENIFKQPWVKSIGIIIVVFGALAGFLYWQSTVGIVLIENSYIVAPIVNLSPVSPGTLNALYVHTGDIIATNTPVALVGTNVITSKEAGVVSVAPDALGGYYNSGATVVSVVKTSGMKVVGSIDENKGLKDVAVGQRATFTVDAFPGKTYSGIVDEISSTANSSSVVFSISDKRPVESFSVKVRFDVSEYPELLNGMSAKITVHTNY